MSLSSSRSALLLAGGATLVIAVIHVAAVLIGPEALTFLDAEPLAVLMEQGSLVPWFATLAVTSVFVVWGLYGLSGAGLLRPLPKLRTVNLAIGAIYTLRGLGVFWFVWLVITDSPSAIPREIGFSLVALAIGLLYLHGGRQLPR